MIRRILHPLGRWRGTHCDRCGQRVTENQSAEATTGGYRLIHFNPDHCARRTIADRWRDLRERLSYDYPALTREQINGSACVHCGRRFGHYDHPVPAHRRGPQRQCAGICVIETAPGLTEAFTGRIHPARRSALHFIDPPSAELGAPWDTVVVVTDEHRTARSERPVTAERAKRLAQQAARLGFDAETRKHSDEKEGQR